MPSVSLCGPEFYCKCIPATTTLQVRSRRSVTNITVQAGCKIAVFHKRTTPKLPRSIGASFDRLEAQKPPKTSSYLLLIMIFVCLLLLVLVALIFNFAKQCRE